MPERAPFVRKICIYVLLPVVGLSTIFWMSCERPTSPPLPNSPPHTKLSNVPVENDTIFPLATFYWTGGDNDGYVARYQFRYITYHFIPGSATIWNKFDSTAWKDTSATSITIAFNSSDTLNRQRFLVRAIDNLGAMDPNPAERILYTTRASPPITKIVAPAKNDTIFVLDHTNDWWSGIQLKFSAKDQTAGGEVLEYAWSVDNSPWHWGKDTTLEIAPENLASPLLGLHIIRVTSRNNTNLVDPVGDSALVYLVQPSFEKKILVIDETDEFNYPFVTYNINDSTVDAFYSRVFGGSDDWDVKAHNGKMPPRYVLAHYQIIIWHADDRPVSVPHKIADTANIKIFTDYLKVGGKFMMSGWGILKSFAYYSSPPFSFQPESFVYDYLHIRTVDETILTGDCIGGLAATRGFSDFHVDSAKIAFFPFNGKLGQVNLITVPAGFTEPLYTYTNLPTSTYVQYRGRPIGLRYYGTVYDAVVLGFPLYFIREEDAKTIASEILHSLNIW